MTFLTFKKLHFNIEITGNSFTFKASDSPQYTEKTLKIISFILSKKLQFLQEESDFYPALKQQSMEHCLKKIATYLYNNLNKKNSIDSEVFGLFNKVFPGQKFHLKQSVFFEEEEKEKISRNEQVGFEYLKKNNASIEKLSQEDLINLFKDPKLYELEYRSFLEKTFLALINKIKREGLNKENKKELNSLFLLAIQHDLPIGIAEFWVKNGADIHAEDRMGKHAFHYALNNNSKKTAEYLVKKKFDLEKIDKESLTVLMHAVKNNHFEWCKFFIEKGANLYTQNKDGERAWNFLFEKNIYNQFIAIRKNKVLPEELPQLLDIVF